jgi:hypothetical protein
VNNHSPRSPRPRRTVGSASSKKTYAEGVKEERAIGRAGQQKVRSGKQSRLGTHAPPVPLNAIGVRKPEPKGKPLVPPRRTLPELARYATMSLDLKQRLGQHRGAPRARTQGQTSKGRRWLPSVATAIPPFGICTKAINLRGTMPRHPRHNVATPLANSATSACRFPLN